MGWLSSVVAVAMMVLSASAAEEWRQVAFIGDAKVFSLSGVVEVVEPKEGKILRSGEKVRAGQVFKVWQGAELILKMASSGSLVRAKGPILVRLAPEKEGFERASVTGVEERVGFVVRAVRGKGQYEQNGEWRPLRVGDVIPDRSRVRAAKGTSMDFYHNPLGTVIRVSEPAEKTLLAKPTAATEAIVASTAAP